MVSLESLGQYTVPNLSKDATGSASNPGNPHPFSACRRENARGGLVRAQEISGRFFFWAGSRLGKKCAGNRVTASFVKGLQRKWTPPREISEQILEILGGFSRFSGTGLSHLVPSPSPQRQWISKKRQSPRSAPPLTIHWRESRDFFAIASQYSQRTCSLYILYSTNPNPSQLCGFARSFGLIFVSLPENQ